MAQQTILNRWDQRVLWQGEAETLKDAVIAAVKAGANLGDANLYGANLRGADLHGAYLGGADLGGADLHGADLGGADLHGAYLGGADLGGADLHGAYLGGADLHGADLRGALNLRLPTGELWIDYLTETVPALLTAGGKSLESFGPSFDCHDWNNCPMAHAFDVHRVDDVPILLRPRAEQFIQFFDARLIPWPLPTRAQLEAEQQAAIANAKGQS